MAGDSRGWAEDACAGACRTRLADRDPAGPGSGTLWILCDDAFNLYVWGVR
jgi:hypothetical protein